ncbi:Ig-like domain-containing protein [Aquibacillus sp. 3ASR75-54]|uniref:Ig-like domain-containing protein n=1 Tax=Aquibacillus salsiterrae TaxID=2950439 RepID=A0A9X3WCK1_9BACI|nr:Ig-like domain-containing protein [Aquibacillus salsiterrae]
MTVVYNDGSEGQVPVTWDEKQLKSAMKAGVGSYAINGTTQDGPAVVAKLVIKLENFVVNPSFESGDRSMWSIDYPGGVEAHTDYQNKAADAKTGDYSLHFYSGIDVDFTVEQTITGLEPGYYNLSMFVQGGDADGSEMYLYGKTGSNTYQADTSVNGWVNWSNPEIKEVLVLDGTITIGAAIKADAGAWGTLDDFALTYVRDYKVSEDKKADIAKERQNERALYKKK